MRRSPQAGPDAGGAGPADSPEAADAAAADAAVAAESGSGEGVPVPEPRGCRRHAGSHGGGGPGRRAGVRGRPPGRAGPPLNRRSPFFIGLAAAAGVAVTIGLIEIVIHARSVLILIGLALFVAAGLDPAVTWLTRHGMRRWLAVITVVLLVLAVVGGFLAAAIPPLAQQTTALADQLPHYAEQLQDHSSELGKLNARYHLEQRLEKLVSSRGTTLASGGWSRACSSSARSAPCWSWSC